tara:strand:- start:2848 stop:3114 length:267 start_codon:yes stop_codon:yes gene_type:complete
MNTRAARELLAAIITSAVRDRRLAVTHGLVDDEANPIAGAPKKYRNDKWGRLSGLNYFFEKGGLETVIELGEFNLNPDAVKRRSKEKL